MDLPTVHQSVDRTAIGQSRMPAACAVGMLCTFDRSARSADHKMAFNYSSMHRSRHGCLNNSQSQLWRGSSSLGMRCQSNPRQRRTGCERLTDCCAAERSFSSTGFQSTRTLAKLYHANSYLIPTRTYCQLVPKPSRTQYQPVPKLTVLSYCCYVMYHTNKNRAHVCHFDYDSFASELHQSELVLYPP